MPSPRKRTGHVIDLDDMLAFIEDAAAAWETYASDGEKRLEYRRTGGYRVTARGVCVYSGTDGRSAVNAYNAS